MLLDAVVLLASIIFQCGLRLEIVMHYPVEITNALNILGVFFGPEKGAGLADKMLEIAQGENDLNTAHV